MTGTRSTTGELHKFLSNYGCKFLLERTRSLVLLMTRDGSLVEWNQAFEAARIDQNLTNLFAMLVPDDHKSFRTVLQKKRTGKTGRLNLITQPEGIHKPYNGWVFPLPDGRILLFAEPETRDADADREIDGLKAELEKTKARLKESEHSLLARDVELKGVLAQVDEIVHIDPQTYLSNRKHIISELQSEVLRSERYLSPLTISMLDIDHFKKVNDKHGHAVGDQALVHLADMLTESMRGTDKIGRIGGEEFLILLPNAKLEAATLQAERLCKLVRTRPLVVGDVQIFVTISIGIAEFRPGKESWQELLSRSDSALYEAKNTGRDRWVTSQV